MSIQQGMRINTRMRDIFVVFFCCGVDGDDELCLCSWCGGFSNISRGLSIVGHRIISSISRWGLSRSVQVESCVVHSVAAITFVIKIVETEIVRRCGVCVSTIYAACAEVRRTRGCCKGVSLQRVLMHSSSRQSPEALLWSFDKAVAITNEECKCSSAMLWKCNVQMM